MTLNPERTDWGASEVLNAAPKKTDPVSMFTSLAIIDKGAPSSYGPGASSAVVPPRDAAMGRQQALAAEYRTLSPDDLDTRIAAARARLGNRVVILGHHYQRDEIIKFADFTGDSFKLSQLAAERKDAKYIVFCGVHFMAESADILSGPDQQVILPNLTAGCSMADMANLEDVEVCWDALAEVGDGQTIPVTYMNSAANLKAFCGENRGIVCTSSNAPSIVSWAFRQGKRVLFFPDEHLGRNTGHRLGVKRSAVWDPRRELGGNGLDDLRAAQMILWKGFCSVHERFTVEQINQARREHPDITVIVHPECHREVVAAADMDGSTEFIIRAIEEAGAASKFVIGTEINLVRRLAAQHPDKLVYCLDPIVCPCSTMYRIHPAYLCWVLENLAKGQVVNQIKVDESTRYWSHVALQRMLQLGN